MIRAILCAALVAACFTAPAGAQTASESVAVDASDVARGILHATLRIPVRPGALTLEYPKWIPGEHGPNGPINELVALRMRAGAAVVPWRRDLVDLYAFHVDVPAGTMTLDVSLDYLIGAAGTVASKERVSSAQLAMINWYALVLTPRGPGSGDVTLAPSITLPPGWQYATALTAASSSARRIAFAPVSLERLNDSPLLTGRYVRKIELDGARNDAELDVAADVPEDLAASDETVGKFRKLIAEADAEYGARHWRTYHFLLTVTDAIDYNGIEHHESSDDRAKPGYLTDADTLEYGADLLPHEFSHSWNGKYRRPADLQVTNFHDPERTDLLWVYEGLTEYLGNVLAARSGLRSAEGFRDQLAAAYADLDVTTGRSTRPLLDTAVQAGSLYLAPHAFAHARRGVDFYPESELLWLEADAVIRRHTGGTKSLDDFVRAFYGPPASDPRVVTYQRSDVVSALNAVAPYDWAKFFRERVDAITLHPPSAGFEADGWRIAYTAEPTRYLREQEKIDEQVDAAWSIGAIISNKGEVLDVIDGSPAAKAGLAPYQHVLAVGGRRFSPEALHAVLRQTAASKAPIAVVVDAFGSVSTVAIAYSGGERYPRLVPIAGVPDTLTALLTARTK